MERAWEADLKTWLRKVRRLVVLGIGNEMKGDDAAGPLCAGEIARRLRSLKIRDVKIINAYDVPENYTGEIRKFQPSHVLLIDSASSPRRPGSVFIVDKAKIVDEDVSTHRIPLLAFISYVEQTMGASVALLGIRPKSMDFGAPLSPAVKNAVGLSARRIAGLIKSSPLNR
jgi:hydrogenase 3 maturation protease